MSYTTLFKVPEQGEIEDCAEFKNAYRGAFNVWSEMAKRYLGLERLPMMRDDGMQRVWDLAKSSNVPLNDRIVMASTFDRVMVKREHLPQLIEAFRDFATRFDPGSLLEQADILEQLKDEPTCYAVCWRQTSVSADVWMVQGGYDKYGESIYRNYDISKDSGHWFLFEEVKAETLLT